MVQIITFGLGVFTYYETPDILSGQAHLNTGWLPTTNLKTFFENLRDAEIQNKLDDFWRSQSTQDDGKRLKNLKLLLPKAGEKKTIDNHGFQVSFELEKAESIRETENRLLNALALNLRPRPEIQQIITRHTKQSNKLSQYLDGLNQLEEELKKGREFVKNIPILNSVRNELQYQRDSLRSRSNFEISVKSISVNSHKNLKPTILLILVIESLAGLFFFIRYVWKGF